MVTPREKSIVGSSEKRAWGVGGIWRGWGWGRTWGGEGCMGRRDLETRFQIVVMTAGTFLLLWATLLSTPTTVCSCLLESIGPQVVVFYTENEALTLFRQQRPNVPFLF